MKNTIITAIHNRRTHHALSNRSTISDDEIIEIVQEALMHVPSAFNAQSSRAVILFEKAHGTMWEIVREELRKIVPFEQLPKTEKKIDTFQAAYGTVLFYEDTLIHESLKERFPLYKEDVETWSKEGQGMLQMIVWTAFSETGLGASLQHYNPLIDFTIEKTFSIPPTWKLIAQMPFGVSTEDPKSKSFVSLSERLIVKK